MYLLGLDVGSSSVKASLVDIKTGRCVASAFNPEQEAPIIAVKAGWAEQNPEDWWCYMKKSIQQVLKKASVDGNLVVGIGISYQMHGLVCVDKDKQVLRPAIIWCDSRGVPYGEKAYKGIGSDVCLPHLLNSPGNFTVSKLAWVKENEPKVYSRIHKVMLPGDYIAMRLTDDISTTIGGLSEGMCWDFKKNSVADFLLEYWGIDRDLIPSLVPTFGEQGKTTKKAAEELGLKEGTPVAYRAGDQPNNALSLNVFNPGEIAATAGTSGVVYGVLGENNYDKLSRVNTFAHVNHAVDETRLGVLLCINGTGISNSWIRRNVAPEGISYSQMNVLADEVPIGSDGISVLPFGNGAERMLQNKEIGSVILGLNYNRHDKAHLLRAVQEGVVFSFCYGMEIMKKMGMNITTIHAGDANMFLNPTFRQTLSSVSGAIIELYDTDGSLGAAKGAGIGIGVYADHDEAFSTLEKIMEVDPDVQHKNSYVAAYNLWKERLNKLL